MAHDATIGDVVAGRYLLERELGRGGMATVYLADDQKLNRKVAIKLLHSELAQQPSFRTRFRQEAQVAARLTHPNIVRVFDAGDATGSSAEDVWPFLVMEYIDGELLSEVIARGPLSTDEAVRIETQLLNALEYAHAAGIVHRDIKPNNIILTKDGDVKVTDFGIAQAVTEASNVVQSTNILGTAAYFSPEQARGEQVDERSDLYSAGIVLFEMLTGQVPFRETSPVRVAYQHLTETAPAPSSAVGTVSPELDAVVAHALAKNSYERFENAAEFREALEVAATGELPEFNDSAELLLTQLDINELDVDELALRQLAQGATAVREPRRPPVMWIWAGGTLIFAMVVAVLFWALALAPSATIASTDRKIPNLTGIEQVEAMSQLKKLDLKTLVLQISDETIATGKVVRTNPAAGTIVTEGTQVSIYISKGKAAVGIPDVSNQTLEQAKATLTAAGFVPGIETKVGSPTLPDGIVAGTTPAAGAQTAPGTTVDILISNGKVTVPSVVGKPLAEATATLSSDALRLPVVQIRDASCATTTGLVVTEQSIGPGDVPQGSTVELTYCSG